MSGTAIWHGEDGAPYEFQVFDPDTHWNDVPGSTSSRRKGPLSADGRRSILDIPRV